MDNPRIKIICKELEMLERAKWKAKDIRAFYNCASEKANRIRKAALANGGKIDFDPHSVTVRSVMALEGTTPEAEIKKRLLELSQTEGATPGTENNL